MRFVVGACEMGDGMRICVQASKRLLVFVADVLKKEGRSAHRVEI